MTASDNNGCKLYFSIWQYVGSNRYYKLKIYGDKKNHQKHHLFPSIFLFYYNDLTYYYILYCIKISNFFHTLLYLYTCGILFFNTYLLKKSGRLWVSVPKVNWLYFSMDVGLDTRLKNHVNIKKRKKYLKITLNQNKFQSFNATYSNVK